MLNPHGVKGKHLFAAFGREKSTLYCLKVYCLLSLKREPRRSFLDPPCTGEAGEGTKAFRYRCTRRYVNRVLAFLRPRSGSLAFVAKVAGTRPAKNSSAVTCDLTLRTLGATGRLAAAKGTQRTRKASCTSPINVATRTAVRTTVPAVRITMGDPT